MGFMDKARKLAEQAQKEAKDGTLKERAKAMADQAQAKIDEVQTQFNDRQKGADVPGPAPETPPAEALAPDADADRSHEAAPKVTGGDPLAG
jgi:hypothetical protein